MAVELYTPKNVPLYGMPSQPKAEYERISVMTEIG